MGSQENLGNENRTESRPRSELVREAARLYIERKKRMKAIINSMRVIATGRGLSTEDVAVEVASYREERIGKP